MNTEIILITDTSASMSSINHAACTGINSFVDEQRTVPGNARVTHVKFNSNVSYDGIAVPLERFSRVASLHPSGMTAMLDGIGEALTTQWKRITAEGWADQTIVVITTDGAENSSRRFGWRYVNQLITLRREQGWQFIFAAANIDAGSTAEQLGISRDHAYAFTADAISTQAMYSTVSATTRAMRAWGL